MTRVFVVAALLMGGAVACAPAPVVPRAAPPGTSATEPTDAWLDAHDTKTRTRFEQDPIALELSDRVTMIWKDRHVVVDVPTPPAPSSPKPNATTSPGGTMAYAEVFAHGLDRHIAFAWRTDVVAAARDTLTGIEASNFVWDEPRGGFYYAYTPVDALHAVRFGAREIRFHRVGTEQDDDETVVAASHDRNQSSGEDPLDLAQDRLLVEVQSGWDGSTRFAIVDLAAKPRTTTVLGSTLGPIEDAGFEGGALVVTIRAKDGSRIVAQRAITNPAEFSVLRTFAPTEHYVREVRRAATIVELGEGHTQRFELVDSRFRTICGWTVPIGEAERLETSGDALVAHRTGLVTIDDTFRVDTATCGHERIRHVESGSAKPMRIDAIEARSADGTSIPIEVLRRADVPLDGKAPLWIYGYGGFRYSQFLPFQAIVRAWVERGGIYAVMHARGGLELGQAWHDDAVRTTHFRTIEDWIACIRELQHRKYGSPRTTLIHGRSHGGLVAARVGIGVPELATEVLAEVPLADMLRFAEKGRGGVTEYGDPDDPRERPALARLSAIASIHRDVRYPAFFVTTATHDERVDPMHPFELASALEAASPSNEVYVKVDRTGGHLGGGDEPFEKKMAEALAWLVERAAASP